MTSHHPSFANGVRLKNDAHIIEACANTQEITDKQGFHVYGVGTSGTGHDSEVVEWANGSTIFERNIMQKGI